MTCTSDSGAGGSVLPGGWFGEIPTQRSVEESTTYAFANGSILKNMGKKVFEGYNEEGNNIHVEWLAGSTHDKIVVQCGPVDGSRSSRGI